MLISFAPNTSMPSLFTIFWDKLAVARQSAIPCAGANALFFGAVWLRVFVSHLYSLTCGPHGKVTLSVRDTPLSWCEKYVFSSVLVGRHRTQRYPTRWFVCPWLDGNNYSEMKRHPSNMMHYNVWIPLIQGFFAAWWDLYCSALTIFAYLRAHAFRNSGIPLSPISSTSSLSLSLHLKMELKMIEKIMPMQKFETSNCWTTLETTYFFIQHPSQKRHLWFIIMNVNLSVGVDELSISFVSLTMSQISRLAWAIDFRMPMREKSPRRLLEHLKVSWLTEGCQVVDYDHASWKLVRKKWAIQNFQITSWAD